MSRRGVSAAATAAAAARARRTNAAVTAADDDSDAAGASCQPTLPTVHAAAVATVTAAAEASASAPCVVAPVAATVAATSAAAALTLTPSLPSAGSSGAPSPPPSDWCPHCSSTGLLIYEASVGARICVGCGHTESRASPRSGDDGSSPSADSGATGNLVDDRVWDDAALKHVQTGSFVRNDGTQMALSASAMHVYTGGTSLSKMARAAGGKEHYVALARQRTFRRAAQVLSLLKLPLNMLPQVSSMLEKLAAQEGAAAASDGENDAPGSAPSAPSVHFTGGVAGDLVIGSCAYALCRDRGRALSMLDVSDALSCNVFKFGRAFQSVCDRLHLRVRELDPTAFVERLLMGVGAEAEAEVDCEPEQAGKKQRRGRPAVSQAAAVPLDDEVRIGVRRQANALLKLARRDWLQAGRTPAGLAGAAVHLALVSAGVAHPLSAIAVTLKLNAATITLRARELKASLFSMAQQTMPWLLDGGKGGRGLDAHLPFIMDNLDTLMQVQDEEDEEANKTGPASVGVHLPSASNALAPPAAAASQPTSTAPPAPASCSLSSLVGRAPTPSDPPSFKRLYFRRSQRVLRIARIARRLEAASLGRVRIEYRAAMRELDVGGVLARLDDAPTGVPGPGAGTDPDPDGDSETAALFAHPLDSEDLLLEKLLLAGVDPSLLVDGNLAGLLEAHSGASSSDASAPAATAAAPTALFASATPNAAAPLSDADLSRAELELYTRSNTEMKQMERMVRLGQEAGRSAAHSPAIKRSRTDETPTADCDSAIAADPSDPAAANHSLADARESPPKRARMV